MSSQLLTVIGKLCCTYGTLTGRPEYGERVAFAHVELNQAWAPVAESLPTLQVIPASEIYQIECVCTKSDPRAHD